MCGSLSVARAPCDWALPVAGIGKSVGIPSWATAMAITVLFFGVVGFVKATGHWNSKIPKETYEILVPNADRAAHPMP